MAEARVTRPRRAVILITTPERCMLRVACGLLDVG